MNRGRLAECDQVLLPLLLYNHNIIVEVTGRKHYLGTYESRAALCRDGYR